MFDSDYDPYEILKGVSQNQVACSEQIVEQEARIQQLEQVVRTQQSTIKQIIGALEKNTQAVKEISQWPNRR